MLHFVLLILKIAVVLLLIALGLLFLLLLSVLLSPVRYRGQGSFYKKTEGILRITWFMHLLSVRISYSGQLEIIVRIFGFPILRDREEPETMGAQAKEPVEELLAGDLPNEHMADDICAEEYGDEPMLSVQELGEAEELKQNEPETGREDDTKPEEGKPDKGKGMAGKILSFFKKLSVAFHKIKEKKDEVTAFLQDEENQKTFKLIIKQFKKVFRHILPLKLKGHVTFGFDEPYTTGQVLSLAAIFYPFYRDRLLITPVFDRQVLEGEISFRGRIRAGTLLIAGIRVLLNKNFRKLLKRFLNRGGI